MKKVLLMIAGFILTCSAYAQVAGDYRTIGDGNWNTLAIWQTYSGGNWIAATSYPGQNTGTNEVFIQTDHDVILTASVPNSIGSIRMGTTGTDATLRFNAQSTIVLNVTGDFRVNDGQVLVDNPAGTNTHSLTIGGNLVVGIETGGGNDIFNMTSGGTDNCNVIFTGNNASITENGPNNTITFNDVTFSSNGNFFVQTTIDDINGIMTINASCELVPAATAVIGDNGSGTLTGTGVVHVTRLLDIPNYSSQYNVLNEDLTGLTVNYSADGPQTISGRTYGSLVISGTGVKTGGVTVATINDNLIIESGTILSMTNVEDIFLSSATVTVDGTLEFTSTNGSLINTAGTSVLNLGAEGLIRTRNTGGLGPIAPQADNASLVNNAGAVFNTNIATNGTVEYYRDGPTPITDQDYNNLIISNVGLRTWTLGSSRTINGNLTVETGAQLTLTGGQTMSVKGNFINNSSGLNIGTTSFAFNGQLNNQIIGGTVPVTFTNITFNNSLGGSPITLEQPVTVTGVATFTDGIVQSTAVNPLIFTATASATGSDQTTDNSYVTGPVVKRGNTAFVFPVGNYFSLGGYMPLAISAPDNIADEIRVEYFRSSAEALGGVTPPLVNVSDCDYWDIDELNDAGTATTLNLTLYWDENSECDIDVENHLSNLSTLTVANFVGPNWAQAGTGNTTITGNITAGTVMRGNISTFGFVAIGNVASESPLPVTFYDVKAFRKGTGIQVEWTNMTEMEVAQYIVERSANGIDFLPVNVTPARSNQSDRQSYSFLDANPVGGTNYYRIKVVEHTAKIIYSKLLKVQSGQDQKGLQVYPNPVIGNSFSIGFTAPKGKYALSVISAGGQKIYSQPVIMQTETISQSVVLPAGTKPGVYTVQINGNGESITKMIIVR